MRPLSLPLREKLWECFDYDQRTGGGGAEIFVEQLSDGITIADALDRWAARIDLDQDPKDPTASLEERVQELEEQADHFLTCLEALEAEVRRGTVSESR